MAHRPTRSKHTTLQQVCNLIPPYLVSKLARKYGVDKKARKFTPWSHVVSLLYAQEMLLHDVLSQAVIALFNCLPYLAVFMLSGEDLFLGFFQLVVEVRLAGGLNWARKGML